MKKLIIMEKNNNWWFYPLLLVFIIFLVGFFFSVKKMKKLDECSKYTLGKLIRTNKAFKQAGRSVWFEFNYNGQHYTATDDLNESNIKDNMIVYVRFSCSDPKINECLCDKKVDSLHLKKLPPEGWDKLPE